MDVLKALIEQCVDVPVKEISVGIFNTYVLGDRAGLSSTLRPENEGGVAPSILSLESTRSLAQLSLSDNPLEASIGIAAINASLKLPSHPAPINGKEILRNAGKDKDVASIGYFPFLPELSRDFNSLTIFERRNIISALSAEEIPEVLPLADVVLLTGMVLTNHTFNEVMQYTKRDAFVIMMGASTPISPLLFEYGVDAVCGTIVEDPMDVLIQVRMGVGYRDLRGIKKVCISKEGHYG